MHVINEKEIHSEGCGGCSAFSKPGVAAAERLVTLVPRWSILVCMMSTGKIGKLESGIEENMQK